MSIKYTNRKGQTYFLCQGRTKTGKPRYYFAKNPADTLLEKIPDGYTIQESVNGVVSLAKERPQLLKPKEIETIQTTLNNHPKKKNYRLSIKPDRLEIYERVGPDIVELMATWEARDFTLVTPAMKKSAEVEESRYAQFTPVMRFILTDVERRGFRVQRMCYRGSIDDWIDIDYTETLAKAAVKFIPILGTEAFFELFQ